MVGSDICSKGVTPLVIFDQGTVDRVEYIKNILSITFKYENKTFEEH